MNVFFFLLLTIYSHQDRRLSFRLVAGHGGVDVGLDVVTVPPHPLSVPDQDGVRRRLSWKKRHIVKIAVFSHDFAVFGLFLAVRDSGERSPNHNLFP